MNFMNRILILQKACTIMPIVFLLSGPASNPRKENSPRMN